MILFSMLVLGLVLGFVGAGGAGIVIAVLTAAFDVPIHTALGTSLAAMIFTTLSGIFGHFREENVAIRSGLAVGVFGAAGALLGVRIATLLPSDDLRQLTGWMLFLSAGLLWLRIIYAARVIDRRKDDGPTPGGSHFWICALGVGLVSGVLSGTFGIGAAPFIQIGLLVYFGLTLPQVAGTTMLVTLPIALMGGIGYLTAGYLDMHLFIKVVVGLMTGSYVGSKFTRRLPQSVLKIAMISVPVIGGMLLVFGHR